MVKTPIRVVAAEYIKDYQIRVRFNDGSQKTIDFQRWLAGEVFQPLGVKREFKRFFVSGGTVAWPNGADIAPETLHSSKDVAAGIA
jgi:hypothetical protein